MNPQQQKEMHRLKCRVITLEAALRNIIAEVEDGYPGNILTMTTACQAIEKLATEALFPPADRMANPLREEKK